MMLDSIWPESNGGNKPLPVNAVRIKRTLLGIATGQDQRRR
jgi:hypothetical protein